MSPARRARSWGSAPVALARLDPDGRMLDANETFLSWAGTAAERVAGRRLSDLFTMGGRIYWETHVGPMLALQGRVDEVAVELRTPAEPLPVLLSAVRRADEKDPGMDVALFASRGRIRFERDLLAARTAAERSAERLRWVQEATAALARAAGVDGVLDALVQAVSANPTIASTELVPPNAPIPAGDRTVVPVVGESRSHGLLVVTTHGRPGDEPLDVDALVTIARQGAIAFDRAVLHEQSVSVAHELQHAMLTQRLPRRAELEVAAEYRPAVSGLEVGGDWYDAFDLDDTTVAVAVGDVVGHGLHAATAMGQLRTATQALARPGLGPAGLLTLVDDFVDRRDIGFAATLVYAELDTRTATLTYACAGHLPPLRVRADGGVEYLWGGRSGPLGVPTVRGARPQGTVRLDPGDLVLLYTDGVVERRDRSLLEGLDRLAQVAGRGEPDRDGELIEHLFDAEANQRDDACVLHLTWHGAAAAPVAGAADAAAADEGPLRTSAGQG